MSGRADKVIKRFKREMTEGNVAQPARVQRAAECSPGRKPGVPRTLNDDPSPVRGDRPSESELDLEYFCRPLRGLNRIFAYPNPGLTPGATFYRHLRWLVEQFLPNRNRVCAIFIFSFLLFPFSFASPQGNDQDYSKFRHTSQKHALLACSSCHHRTDNSAQPSFPGHRDCIECHRTQYATPNSPLCSICHSDLNGKDPPRKAFPASFKESFNMKFDHAQHMSGAARPKSGCVACHSSSLRRGAALSIPASLSAHNQCYTCHTPSAQSNGRDIASCKTCHDQKAYARTPTTSVAFSYAFSHAQHSARQRLNCADCHNYTAGLPQRRQVSSTRPAEHFPTGNNSCATCHNGRRSFGGDLDFKNCRRCHAGQSFRIGT